MVESLVQDVRFAVRLLRKSPLFTITAALSLAIGIGANTTIFSIANALLMRPLPGLAEPERLVDLGRTTRGQGFDTVSYPYYLEVRRRSTTLDGVFAYRLEPTAMSLGGSAEPERVYGTLVSGSYFPTLGTRPALGRLLQDADDITPGGHPVVVISHELWTRRFGNDPSIVGRRVTLNSTPFTVVGVTPRGFQGTTLMEPDLWMPLSMFAEGAPRMTARMLTEPRIVWLVMGGRLRDGVGIPQAQGELSAVAAALQREFPDAYRDRGIAVARSALVPGRTGMVAAFVGLLMAIVGLVLLIACVNVTGMMLARAVARRREIAVRLAIGAGRGRLVRQLITEAVIVFAAGGVAGLMLSRWLTSLLMALLPRLPVPVAIEVTTDWRVVSFAVALSLAAAVLSALVPALHAARGDLLPALRTEGLDPGPSRMRLRHAFVVGQIAMSLLLVVVGGLFLRSLQHATSIHPGFDQQRVDVVSLDLSVGGVRTDSEAAFVRELLHRVRALSGVESAAVAWDLPLDAGRSTLGVLKHPGADRADAIPADWNVVEPGFFETLKIRMLRGRDFSESDTGSTPRVAIVNEALARRLWPGREALGQRVVAENPEGEFELTIVGVADDARMVSLGSGAEPYVYVPMTQQSMSRISLLVRNRGDMSMVPQVRAVLRELDPTLPITEALPLRDVTAIGLVPQRVAAAVAGSLGLVGLILAAMGIYGVTAFAVSRRTREIGVRIALGADEGRVLRLVLRQAASLAGCGVAIGLILAGLGSTLLDSLLFGMRGLDPATFLGACVLFGLVTLAASYVPARRAARVNPTTALRTD